VVGAGGGRSDTCGTEFGCLVLETPDDDFGGVVGGVEFALSGDFGEEVAGVLTGALGFGESGGQGRPGGIGHDAGGVVGKSGVQGGGVALGGLGAGGA
jgi:hypothetical protein